MEKQKQSKMKLSRHSFRYSTRQLSLPLMFANQIRSTDQQYSSTSICFALAMFLLLRGCCFWEGLLAVPLPF